MSAAPTSLHLTKEAEALVSVANLAGLAILLGLDKDRTPVHPPDGNCFDQECFHRIRMTPIKIDRLFRDSGDPAGSDHSDITGSAGIMKKQAGNTNLTTRTDSMIRETVLVHNDVIAQAIELSIRPPEHGDIVNRINRNIHGLFLSRMEFPIVEACR